MNVLVACEESQRICIAFREKGHRAFSCDLQECSGGHPEWHIQGDVLSIINGCCMLFLQNGNIEMQYDKWDLIIAHPPCTYLSNAGACRMYRVINGELYINARRYDQMQDGKNFFNKMLAADCDKIAVENPLPMRICDLPEPTQIIQPYEYGHPYSKRTLLWLKGLPPLKPTKIIKEHIPYLPSSTSNFAKGIGGGQRSRKRFKELLQDIFRHSTGYGRPVGIRKERRRWHKL